VFKIKNNKIFLTGVSIILLVGLGGPSLNTVSVLDSPVSADVMPNIQINDMFHFQIYESLSGSMEGTIDGELTMTVVNIVANNISVYEEYNVITTGIFDGMIDDGIYNHTVKAYVDQTSVIFFIYLDAPLSYENVTADGSMSCNFDTDGVLLEFEMTKIYADMTMYIHVQRIQEDEDEDEAVPSEYTMTNVHIGDVFQYNIEIQFSEYGSMYGTLNNTIIYIENTTIFFYTDYNVTETGIFEGMYDDGIENETVDGCVEDRAGYYFVFADCSDRFYEESSENLTLYAEYSSDGVLLKYEYTHKFGDGDVMYVNIEIFGYVPPEDDEPEDDDKIEIPSYPMVFLNLFIICGVCGLLLKTYGKK
jgi:hypothetical protein